MSNLDSSTNTKNDASLSNFDPATMTSAQRFAFEQRLEDEYVSGELSWTSKKQVILRTWADLLFYYVQPTKSICAYIKNRLRLRGVSEGAVLYVNECLTDDYAKYKDPSFDHSSLGKPSASERPSIFEDFDDLAKNTLTPEQLEERSPAEQFEIISREYKQIKGLKTKMTDRIDFLENFSKNKKIKIPEFEKTSADIPPEEFHGMSEMYYDAEGFENEHLKMAKSWKDIKQTIYYFRPSPEVAARSSQLYKQFKESKLRQLQTENLILLKAYQNILTPLSDAKWGDLLSGWFKIGHDQQVNYGSNGAGVKNAIPTGYIVLKRYRDGREELISKDRSWTKEQVGDNMEEKLIKLALIQVTANKIEKAHQNWINNTNLVEVVNKE